MSAVLSGLGVIWAVIALGWILGATGILGPEAKDPLNRLVYTLGLPALVFLTLARANIAELLGAPLAVAGISASLAALIFWLLGRFVLRLSPARTLIGTMGSSLANAAYLGVPLAQYILGSAAHVAPVILFQMGILTPALFIAADVLAVGHRPSVRSVLAMIGKNPLLWSAIAGGAVSVTGITLPQLVIAPIEILGGAAVPCILIAFGLSFVGERPAAFRPAALAISVATSIKLIVQPVLGYLCARYLFGASGIDLFAMTLMSGLPTAQNAYLAAFRVGQGDDLARGTVLATTVLIIPSFVLIAAFVGVGA